MRAESVTEGVLLALDQLRANKFRSGLTILGVLVGVATVVAIGAVITGVRSDVLAEIAEVGPKNFTVARFDFTEVRLSDVGEGEPPWADTEPITVAEARRIKSLDKVRLAIVDVDASVPVTAGNRRLESVHVGGDDVGWRDYSRGTLSAGHDFLPADIRASRPVAVLTDRLAETLFGGLDPIGRRVRMNGTPFRVIGVFDVEGDGVYAIVPYTAAIKHLNADPDWIELMVVPTDDATQAEAIDQVITALRVSRGLRPLEANDFAIIRQQELVDMFNRLTAVFFIVMIVLSSVGLMVGGVGVIGVMMIAVTERTREIGIRKAVGATRAEILWQFLVEAATVTTIGGALGLLVGGGGAVLLAGLTSIPARVPLSAVATALVMAAVAGVLFGLWPAWRAARLDPVVALRHE